MDALMFVKEVFFLLMLVNPFSKIAIVPVLIKNRKELHEVVLKSTLFGGIILVVFALLGPFILNYIFQVDISSIRIVGGIVIFYFGFQALRKGFFFEFDRGQKLVELAMVPLASPLIAGPATIAVVIYNANQYSAPLSLGIIISALLINLLGMYFSPKISQVLNEYNLTGASIRIIGIFVASIGIQMIIMGLKSAFPLLA